MRGLIYIVLLLLFLLLIVEPERAERENSLDLRERDDGGGANHKGDTPAENQHENEDGLNGSIDETKQKDGPSVRLKLTIADFIAIFVGFVGLLGVL